MGGFTTAHYCLNTLLQPIMRYGSWTRTKRPSAYETDELPTAPSRDFGQSNCFHQIEVAPSEIALSEEPAGERGE